MRKISIEEQKRLQMAIMDYVDAFCRQNDIHYTISGGTLLGAVRHGGYIPWDDDIDIQMLRNEYDLFTRLWNSKSGHGHFELVNIESGNSMGYPFGKIHDTRTITLVDGLKRTGVFVDVFPMDGIVDERDFRKRHAQMLRLYDERSKVFEIMKWKYGHLSWKSRLRLLLTRIPRKSYNEIAEDMDALARQYSTDGNYVFEMVAGTLCKRPIPTEVFHSYKDIAFEDRLYMSVSDTDTYLTNTFGDYMTLPPEEKRVSHHGFESYWL